MLVSVICRKFGSVPWVYRGFGALSPSLTPSTLRQRTIPNIRSGCLLFRLFRLFCLSSAMKMSRCQP